MNRILLSIILSAFIIGSNAQTCSNSLVIRAIADSSVFKEAVININYANQPSSGYFGVSEIESLGWTNSASGFPSWINRTLFQYNLSAIPKNATVTSAKLFLYAKTVGLHNGNLKDPTFGSKNTSLLQRVTAPWNMTTVGWATQPSTVADATQKTLAQSTSLAQNYVVDMTDFAQIWVNNPESNYGVLLKLQTEQTYNSMIFNSFGDADSLKPRLEICYTMPACINSIALKADSSSGNYQQALLNNNFATTSSAWSNSELESLGWTNNSWGYPAWTQRTLFKYKLNAVPKDATITSAKLYLYAKKVGLQNGNLKDATFGSNNTSLIQRVTGAWDMFNVGWATQPATTSINQKTLAQSTSLAQDYVIDMTDFAQLWVNHPDSNYGMLLKLQSEQTYNSMIFNSFADADSVKPRLEICYTMPLPISLASFNGTIANDLVNLNWITTDANIASTTVERSYDGVNFSIAGSVAGKGSIGASNYRFTDKVSSATKVYYRLKLISKDGHYNHSQTITLVTGGNGLQTLAADVYPNPVRNTDLNVSLYLIKEDALTIRVFDINGKLVYTQKVQGQKGFSTLSIAAFKTLSAGTYNVNITTSKNVINKKVVKL